LQESIALIFQEEKMTRSEVKLCLATFGSVNAFKNSYASFLWVGKRAVCLGDAKRNLIRPACCLLPGAGVPNALWKEVEVARTYDKVTSGY
jgi:hypothetical protein